MKLALAMVLFASYSFAVPLRARPFPALAVGQEPSADVRDLELNAPVEQALASGQTHTYRIALRAGQYIHVSVGQPTLAVKVTVSDPLGKTIREANWETRGSTESIWALAETSGNYLMKVTAIDTWAEPQYAGLTGPIRRRETRISGTYNIELAKLGEFQTAPTADRINVEASELYFEADQLRTQGSEASRKQALNKLEESLPLWRALQDRVAEAFTLMALGRVYFDLAEIEKGSAAYAQALQVWQALKNHPEQEATALYNLGELTLRRGDYEEAIVHYQQAIKIRQQLGDSVGQAFVLGDLGTAYYYLGNYPEALAANLEALRLRQVAEEVEGQARSLSNISAIYSSLGEYQEALNYCKQALPLRRAIGDRRGEGITLINIGTNYRELGQPQTALEYYRQAQPLVDSFALLSQKIALLDRMGRAYYDLNDYSKALEFHQRARSLQGPADEFGEAAVLADIGNDYVGLKEAGKALEYFEKALKLYRHLNAVRGEALVLQYAGKTHLEAGDLSKAQAYFNEALDISRAIKSKPLEANMLYYLGRAERVAGHPDKARERVEAAIEIIESARAKVVSSDLRASFLASKQDFYEFDIDLLMQDATRAQGQDDVIRAFEVSERKRARGLLDSLVETQTNIRSGVSSELLDHERHLQQELNGKADRQIRLLGQKHTDEQVATISGEIDRLTIDYEQLLSQIRQSSPRYAALTQPVPLSLKQIQTQVLDSDSILMEYSLGEDKSYLWTVTPAKITAYELPARAKIENLGRRVYELLTARNQQIRFETPIAKRARIARADDQYYDAARELSEMLIGPARLELKGKRLLIAADGILSYVPFGALPSVDVAAAGSSTGWTPLLASHEIVSLPSASTVNVLRAESAGRKPAPKTVAVLADAVFQADDLRVKRDPNKSESHAVKGSAGAVPNTEPQRSQRDFDELEFRRLPYSRQEADGIVGFAPRGMAKESLDFEASRTTATSPDLANYRIIHLATHGFLDSHHPELSGIVLSLVDEAGGPQNGFLRLNEIYDLKLNADLVVLSGCRTALGKEIRGEGLIGLTRGFMYAGAPRVIASLWSVDDVSTAELMKRFYRALLLKKQTPAAALRSAQASLWKDTKLPPYYWAAFVLQGEWK